MRTLAGTALLPGLADPLDDAQRLFRLVLAAMAEPGKIMSVDLAFALPPGRLGHAAIAVGLALLDFETPIWLDSAAETALPHFRFHCHCPEAASREDAAFAFIGDPMMVPPLESFALGTDAYPDRSATLVIEIFELTETGDVSLRGPGILQHRRLGVAGVPARLWAERADLAPLFPRGRDLILTCGDRFIALPRTTRLEG